VARPKGSLNKSTHEARDFCRLILESEAYRLSLVRRLANDTLPPALEVLIWHYRYGRPKEQVDIAFNAFADLEDMTPAELEERAKHLIEKIRADRAAKGLPEPSDPSTH
jgi:hypothetical protein